MSSLEQHLQTHARALRALARALVGAQDADDLLQETALQALTAPPRRPGPLGGWLAQVVRHLASKQHRGERRRRRREAALGAATRREAAAAPPPDEQLATRETFRRLTEAVLALPAPYQDAVLRRYLQEQTPAVIAAQTGVPLATVKSRLQRGLDLLRQRFEGEDGDWRAALTGTLGLRATGAALGVGITTGALVMTGTGVKFALGAAAVLLVVAATFVYLGAGAGGSSTVGAGASPTGRTLAAADGGDANKSATGEGIEPRRIVASPSTAAATDLATLRGRVVDEHGQPRGGVDVTLTGRIVQSFDLTRAAAPQPRATWSDPPAQRTRARQGHADPRPLRVRSPLDLLPDTTQDLGDVRLPSPSRIAVQTRLPGGVDPAGLRVSLAHGTGPAQVGGFVSPPVEGLFTSQPLAAGDYMVHVSGPRTHPVARAVRLREGQEVDPDVELSGAQPVAFALTFSEEAARDGITHGLLRILDGDGAVLVHETLWGHFDDFTARLVRRDLALLPGEYTVEAKDYAARQERRVVAIGRDPAPTTIAFDLR